MAHIMIKNLSYLKELEAFQIEILCKIEDPRIQKKVLYVKNHWRKIFSVFKKQYINIYNIYNIDIYITSVITNILNPF